jgi:hypothetical protein
MAKVLSCPDCGHKHQLDLLAGLDYFMCKSCGKKLAVPVAAIEVKKENDDKKVLTVVASSTLNEHNKGDVKKKSVVSKLEKIDDTQKSSSSDVKNESTDGKENLSPRVEDKQHVHLPNGHIAKIGFSLITKLIIWGLSIGLGFLLVVIIPRLFGFGFHAIDFVDVITQHGILKYKVVVYLVVLWSLTTAIAVGLFNSIFNKFKRTS